MEESYSNTMNSEKRKVRKKRKSVQSENESQRLKNENREKAKIIVGMSKEINHLKGVIQAQDRDDRSIVKQQSEVNHLISLIRDLLEKTESLEKELEKQKEKIKSMEIENLQKKLKECFKNLEAKIDEIPNVVERELSKKLKDTGKTLDDKVVDCLEKKQLKVFFVNKVEGAINSNVINPVFVGTPDNNVSNSSSRHSSTSVEFFTGE